MSFQCAGCERHFGRVSNLIQHHKKGNSPACLTAAELRKLEIRKSARLPRRNPSRSSLRRTSTPGPSTATQNDIPEPPQAPAFTGDVFGDATMYTEADFPGFAPEDDGENVDTPPLSAKASENEEEDDQDVEDSPVDAGWEPPRRGVTMEDVSETEEEDAEKADASGSTSNPGSASAAGEPSASPGDFATLAREAEVHVEHFPGNAGTPIANLNASKNAFERYEEALPSNDEQRPSSFAPFLSKLEWELAHWAKLDGPSASSFNRLLKINGVWDCSHAGSYANFL